MEKDMKDEEKPSSGSSSSKCPGPTPFTETISQDDTVDPTGIVAKPGVLVPGQGRDPADKQDEADPKAFTSQFFAKTGLVSTATPEETPKPEIPPVKNEAKQDQPQSERSDNSEKGRPGDTAPATPHQDKPPTAVEQPLKCSSTRLNNVAFAVAGGVSSYHECVCDLDGPDNPMRYAGSPYKNDCCDTECKSCRDGCKDERDLRDSAILDPLLKRRFREGDVNSIAHKRARRTIVRGESQSNNELLIRVLDDHGADWKKLALKGVQLYKEWQNAKAQPQSTTYSIEDDLNIQRPIPVGELAATTKGMISGFLGHEAGAEYWRFSAKNLKIGASFQTSASVNDGVFVANAVDRGGREATDTNAKVDPIALQFSDIAWWIWQRAVISQAKKDSGQTGPDQNSASEALTDQNIGQQDFWGLRYIVQARIKNEETSVILNELFAGKENDGVQGFFPTSPDHPGDNAFWPLLGSPNGRGTIYLLKDQKGPMRGKGI